MTFLRAIKLCSAFTPDCGYDNSVIILIGDVYCQIQIVWVNFAGTKRLFNLSAEAIINIRNAHLCASAEISFWISNKFLFVGAWSRGLHFWRESKINSRCHWRCVLSRWALPQQREMQIYWWLSNNSEIHLWLWELCGLVVCSQSSFHVTRARKDDKNRQNTLFLSLKNMLHDKQLFNQVPFQSTKYRKKELCVDNKVREIIGDVYCPKCRNEKCVYLSTKKTTSFYDCKKRKACCNVLNFPFRDQKPTFMLFGGDGTNCFARKTSRHYEKEKPSPFLLKFLSQSQPSTSEPEPRKVKMSPNIK